MALDFLLNALPAMASMFYNIRGQSAPYLPQQEALTQRMTGLSDAMLDPNNPIYQNLYKQNKEDMSYGLSSAIAEAQRQNRQAVRLGRAPLFSAERGGEDLFRALMKGQQNSTQAASMARSQIAGAAQPLSQALSSYSNLTPLARTRSYQQTVQPFNDISTILPRKTLDQQVSDMISSNPSYY